MWLSDCFGVEAAERDGYDANNLMLGAAVQMKKQKKLVKAPCMQKKEQTVSLASPKIANF